MMNNDNKNISGVKNSQSGRSVGKMLKGGKKHSSQTSGGYSGNALKPSGKSRFPNGRYQIGTD